MKHIIFAAGLILAASPAMAKDRTVDMPGFYEYLTHEPDLPRVPQAGPYGEVSKTRDIAPAQEKEKQRD